MKLSVLSFLVAVFILTIVSCSQDTKISDELTKETIISVELASFVAQEGEFENITGADKIDQLKSLGGWLEYHLDVPVAGRYQFEVEASNSEGTSGKTVWVEDYVGNIDDRTYNITGNIEISEITTSSYYRDGSPMNKGLHKIRLHVDEDIVIDKIQFKLLKKHQITPTSFKQNMEGEEWVIAWSDEFDGPELDTTKWIYDLGDWGWGNGEHQYYTENRKENVRIEDGNLIIEARKGDLGYRWTSGRITTRGKVSFVHGKIEFRAKVPKEKGNWAAGWTLGDNYIDEISWPYCGEIDILESVGFEMDDDTGTGIAHASAHCGAYYFKIGNQPTGILEVENMDTEYHDYAVEWTSQYVKAFVDGQHYFTYDDNSTELSWPFDDPQNIILNLAAGGGWGGAQGMDTTVTSQKMIIDYVRVYERK